MSPHCLNRSLPLQHQQDPHSFLRRQHQGNQSGITLGHQNHPKMTLCQTLTQLGLSCQNLTHWNWKNVALISSLKNDGFEMASSGESMMGYVVFDIQWCANLWM